MQRLRSSVRQHSLVCRPRRQRLQLGIARRSAMDMGLPISNESWEAALTQLTAATPQQRSEAIDQITELLQASDWALPEGRAAEIVAQLGSRLTDTNWCAARRPRAACTRPGTARTRSAPHLLALEYSYFSSASHACRSCCTATATIDVPHVRACACFAGR